MVIPDVMISKDMLNLIYTLTFALIFTVESVVIIRILDQVIFSLKVISMLNIK